MNLYYALHGAVTDIIYSKRFLDIFYALFGVVALANTAIFYMVFLALFDQANELSVPMEDEEIVAGIATVFAVWVGCAFILRSYLQKIRIALEVRRAIKVVTYATEISPAEAGFLTDYRYATQELVATLLDLHFRGVIHMSVDTNGGVSVIQANSGLQTSYYERELLTISELNAVTFQGFNDYRMLSVAEYAHEMLMRDLSRRNLIQPARLKGKLSGNDYKIVGLTAVMVLGALTNIPGFGLGLISNVLHPRYPLGPLEAVALNTMAIIVILVLLSSLWPRIGNKRNSSYTAWIEAEGLRMYVESVFKDRFSEQNIAYQDAGTLRKYSAYAIAYGVTPCSTGVVAKILDSTRT